MALVIPPVIIVLKVPPLLAIIFLNPLQYITILDRRLKTAAAAVVAAATMVVVTAATIHLNHLPLHQQKVHLWIHYLQVLQLHIIIILTVVGIRSRRLVHLKEVQVAAAVPQAVPAAVAVQSRFQKITTPILIAELSKEIRALA